MVICGLSHIAYNDPQQAVKGKNRKKLRCVNETSGRRMQQLI